MSNIVAIGKLDNLISYLPDGVKVAVNAVKHALPPDLLYSDALALFAFTVLSTTKQEVSATAGARPILFVAKSTGTKCWVHVYNNPAASVTEGVDVDFVVPVGGTSGEATVLACFGSAWKTFWDTGITVSASTATETSAAPTNKPDVWVLYG